MSGIKVFISYRRDESDYSKELRKILRKYGFEKDNIFLDTFSLRGGDYWEEKIYENVRNCDVLIVLVGKDTAKSDWVQREVDVARGANVSILPIFIRGILAEADEKTLVGESMNLLAISDRNYITQPNTKKEKIHLIELLYDLSQKTRRAQADWYAELSRQRNPAIAKNKQKFYEYSVDGCKCKLIIATGDITRLSNIDVLVNSENNYMQMARAHSPKAVSSALRYRGAWVDEYAGTILEDTIQEELDAVIKEKIGFRPVAIQTVLVTSAGRNGKKIENGRDIDKYECKLHKRTNARYIFHAATVQINFHMINKNIAPLETDDAILQTVENCFKSVDEVDGDKGVVSPKGSYMRKVQEEAIQKDTYQWIRSIAFPIFGTGSGGRSVSSAIRPMGEAVKLYLQHNPNTHLEEIYFCIHHEQDIKLAKEVLDDVFKDL